VSSTLTAHSACWLQYFLAQRSVADTTSTRMEGDAFLKIY